MILAARKDIFVTETHTVLHLGHKFQCIIEIRDRMR